jgi:nucleoside-diphosphate-sugar epimerase
MKVLVTGAAGFLGGALTQALLREGQEVRILARRTSQLQQFDGLPVDVRRGSLEDKASLVTACRDIELIYHCAALASDWAPWDEFYRANVQGVENLLEAARAVTNLQRLIHISTTDVYGYPVAAVDETYPITDIGLPYNRSKGLGEKKVWEIYCETGLPVTVIRPATIYGPRSLSIVVEIAALLRKKQMALIDGGRMSAGLLYIDNAVDGILQAARSPQTIGQAYNLRDESNETWRQFVSVLASGMGASQPWMNLPGTPALGLAHLFEAVYRVLGIRHRPLLTRHAVYLLCRTQGYSIKKAQQDFGFRSKIGFAEGMARTQVWLASQEGQAALAKL